MNTELKNILDEYAAKRAREENRVTNLLKKLMEENQQFKSARQEYSSARAKLAGAKLQGGTYQIDTAKEKYNKELKAACKKSGIEISDLQIKYLCADCRDTGYTGENQKVFCHCIINRMAGTILSAQNMNEENTFENFDESIFPNNKAVDKEGRNQREHILHIKERAISWCDSSPDDVKQQLLIMGKTGVGKSFIANCIANYSIKNGFSVVNATAGGINEAMLKVINEKDNSLIKLFKNSDLLIIDDLGVESILRNITIETLYDIIEYRLVKKKRTIIVTNLTLPAMQEKYGYRIFSRISSKRNTALLQIMGDDLRRL